MAGHSQFKNIMHRKGAQDKKRAKLFSKLGREITVAAKLGTPDPTMNARLRAAILAARDANMPKDNIERAIKKASGPGEDSNFAEVRYEGYGPAGVAVIVEALTDNRHRTASEVRSAFTKCGGNLGETNSVSFMFERLGIVTYPAKVDGDAIFEAALDAGAKDVAATADGHEVSCAPDDFNVVREALETKFGAPENARIDWKPQTTVALDEEAARSLFKLLDALDDNDDVQRVAANFDVSDEVMARLSA